MGSEDGCNINSTLLTQRNCYTSKPFVEVCNDSRSSFMIGVIELIRESGFQLDTHTGLVGKAKTEYVRVNEIHAFPAISPRNQATR